MSSVSGKGLTGALMGGNTGVNLTSPCCNASVDVTVGDDVGTVVIQLQDAKENAGGTAP